MLSRFVFALGLAVSANAVSAAQEVNIYPGADATLTIHEDDNETYAYEKGRRYTGEAAVVKF